MFWNIFYALCESHGTTPNAVCKKLKLSNATATHWKNGTIPRGDILLNLADYFNCSVDYLLGRTNQSHVINENNYINEIEQHDELLAEFAIAFKSLNLSDKIDIMNIIHEKLKNKS